MGSTLNPNILFRLSGVSGDYTFEQNPEAMDIRGFKNFTTKVDLLVGEDIAMHALIDNEVRVMKWSVVDKTLFSTLLAFAQRDSLGNIPVNYFWDGTVNEFRGDPVQVLTVFATPIAGKFNKYTLEVQFKPVQV